MHKRKNPQCEPPKNMALSLLRGCMSTTKPRNTKKLWSQNESIQNNSRHKELNRRFCPPFPAKKKRGGGRGGSIERRNEARKAQKFCLAPPQFTESCRSLPESVGTAGGSREWWAPFGAGEFSRCTHSHTLAVAAPRVAPTAGSWRPPESARRLPLGPHLRGPASVPGSRGSSVRPRSLLDYRPYEPESAVSAAATVLPQSYQSAFCFFCADALPSVVGVIRENCDAPNDKEENARGRRRPS